MRATYSFYSNKDGITKSIPAHVRYVFDDNGKIISTYGVKSESENNHSLYNSAVKEAR